AALDPQMEAAFTELVRELRDDGGTVLLSSHILAEVEKLCDTVTIIRNGPTEQAGKLDELRHLTRNHVVAQARDDPSRIEGVEGVHDLEVDSNQGISFTLDRERTGEVMRTLTELGLVEIVSTPPSLEELFLGHYHGRG